MTPTEREIAAWRAASRDLGIEFISPFQLKDDGEALSYIGLVPGFGSKKGTAIIFENDLQKQNTLIRVAAAHGYGYSCLGPDGSDYDRDSFVEMLNEWEWVVDEPAPSWYFGPAAEADDED
jgi:hypothetical protein